MLVPSSNTVVEATMSALLPPDGSVTAHVARLRVVTIADDAASLAQFELEPTLVAAELLADARVDLILWNGTAASWLGFARDDRVVAAIEARTGIAATTAMIAINAELARLGARRIGLVTPYVAGLERAIIENFAGAEIVVAAAVRCDLVDNTAFAAIEPARIEAMVYEAARVPVDAILILCTNLAGAAMAPRLEAALGIPVLDSVRVAIAHSLQSLRAIDRESSDAAQAGDEGKM
jgi:maleate isomerase